MNRGIVGILGAVVSASVSAVLAGQAREPLIVAYIPDDGELVPIARHEATGWRNSWPEPVEHDAPLPVRTVGEIPSAWLGQPVPLTWTVWSVTGGQRPVTVTGVDRDGSCFQAITLSASSKADAPADGLAFNRSTKVDAILQLDQTSPPWDVLRRELVPHFRTAALGRADKFDTGTVDVVTVFQDPRLPVFFIGAHRIFEGIAADADYDALSYEGWFRRERAGALSPIRALVTPFSTAAGKLPRYTPIGILRFGASSIWVMSEWGQESQSIVLFDVSAKRVAQLTSALVSGC